MGGLFSDCDRILAAFALRRSTGQHHGAAIGLPIFSGQLAQVAQNEVSQMLVAVDVLTDRLHLQERYVASKFNRHIGLQNANVVE